MYFSENSAPVSPKAPGVVQGQHSTSDMGKLLALNSGHSRRMVGLFIRMERSAGRSPLRLSSSNRIQVMSHSQSWEHKTGTLVAIFCINLCPASPDPQAWGTAPVWVHALSCPWQPWQQHLHPAALQGQQSCSQMQPRMFHAALCELICSDWSWFRCDLFQRHWWGKLWKWNMNWGLRVSQQGLSTGTLTWLGAQDTLP